MKSISKFKVLVAALAGAIGFAAVGGVYDDVLWWCNGPIDKNSDGVLQQGEVVDILHGGLSSHTSHNGSMTRTSYIATDTVTTPAFSRTLSCLKFEDSDNNKGAFVDILSQINAAYKQRSEAFTSIVRFKWDGTSRNTAWFLNVGGELLGVNSTGVRFYPGENTSALPVAANTWYDIGFVITKLEGDGCNVRILLRKADGTTYALNKNYSDSTKTGSYIGNTPAPSGVWNIATESGNQKEKYFTGLIQQVAYWNRGLSTDELLEAFNTQPPMPSVVGVVNGSGDEFGGDGTEIVMDGDWKNVPKTLAAGGSYTVKFAGAVDSACELKVKGVSGATTLKVGGNSVDIADGGEVELFVSQSAITSEGGNTSFTLQNTGSTDLLLDALSLTENAIKKNYVTYTENATTNLVIAQDEMLVITVPEGYSVVCSGTISGAGTLVKRGGGTLQLGNVGNTYAGGTVVEEGTLISVSKKNVTTTPFGTGLVTVNCFGGAQLQTKTDLANDIAFAGNSTRERPGLYLAGKTKLLGDIMASGDLYIDDCWAANPDGWTGELFTMNGTITVAAGSRLAAAPNCHYIFNGAVTADVVEGYGANDDFAGDMLFKAVNAVGRLVIDWTSIKCGLKNCFADTIIEFTGVHKVDGKGMFDLNGFSQEIARADAPDSVFGVDDEGGQIINTSSTAAGLTLNGPAGSDDICCKFDGNITTLSVQKALKFGARRNSMAGVISTGSGTMTCRNGCEFPNVTSISGSNSSGFDGSALGAGALAGLKSFGANGSFTCKVSARSVTPRQVSFTATGLHSTTRGCSTRLYIYGDDGKSAGTVEAVNFSYREEATTGTGGEKIDGVKHVNVPNGIYTAKLPNAEAFQLGTIKVVGSTSDADAITWTGASNTDIANIANWNGTDGQPITQDDYFQQNVMVNPMVFAGPGQANVSSSFDMYALCMSGGFTFTGSGLLTFGNGGIQISDALDADTSYSFSTPLRFLSDTTIAIPTNGTFTSTGGFTGMSSVVLLGRNQGGDASVSYTTPGVGTPLSGLFEISGDNTLSGNLVTTGANVNISGVLGRPGDKSTFTPNCSVSSPSGNLYGNLRFCGLTCYKGVCPRQVAYSATVLNSYCSVVFAADTENVFESLFSFFASNRLNLEEGATVTFNDGYECGNSQRVLLAKDATLVFNGMVKTGTDTASKGCFDISATTGSKVVFNPPDEANAVKITTYMACAGGEYVFGRGGDVVSIAQYISMVGNAKMTLGDGVLLQVPALRMNAGCTVNGAVGTGIEVTDGADAESDCNVAGAFTGGASLIMSGTKTLFLSGQNTSTGDVIVESGKLKFAPTSSWLYVTNFVVRNEGTLEFAAAGQVNKAFAALHVADQGQIYVPEGVRMRFASATLDGELVDEAIYPTGTEGSTGLSAHITGGGSIRIKRPGTVVVVH